MSTMIKICGITNMNDAKTAISCGANFLGFIFVPDSPRFMNLTAARSLVDSLKGQVATVGVFKDPEPADVAAVLEHVDLDFIQYHGTEPPDLCEDTELPVIKTFELKDNFDWNILHAYEQYADYFLFERPKTYSDEYATFSSDDIIEELIQREDELPSYFFAGGLTPDNVGSIVSQLRPFGVDVASGVEDSPGFKDAEKLKEFCDNVKRANPCDP